MRNLKFWSSDETITVLLIFLIQIKPFPVSCQYQINVKSVVKISNLTGGMESLIRANDHFGDRLCNIGDLDGDGNNDLAVGADFFDNTPSNKGEDNGAIWILLLDQDGSIRNRKQISGISGNFGFNLNSQDRFGHGIANLGDLDGDSVNDLAVSVIGEDNYSGGFYILFLNKNGTVKSAVHPNAFKGELSPNDIFGVSISNLGDVDGDGIVDLALGSSGDDDGGADRGAVYIVFLNKNGTVKSYYKIGNNSPKMQGILSDGDIFGIGTAAIGDIDKDGIPDMAVGSQNDDEWNPDAGAVYFTCLNKDGSVKTIHKIDNANGKLLELLNPRIGFGVAITKIPDVNHDNNLDLAVGALYDVYNGELRGSVYILNLDSNFNITSYKKIDANEALLSPHMDDGDKFGTALDLMNFDSSTNSIKIAIGASGDDEKFLNDGSVYLVDLKFCKEISSGNELSIYPNPTENSIHIAKSNCIEIVKITLYDALGKQLEYFSNLNNSVKEFNLNLLNYSSGFYTLKISTTSKTSYFKIIKTDD